MPRMLRCGRPGSPHYNRNVEMLGKTAVELWNKEILTPDELVKAKTLGFVHFISKDLKERTVR